jgi:hypothetical protein
VVKSIVIEGTGAVFSLTREGGVISLFRIEVRTIRVTPQKMYEVTLNSWMTDRASHVTKVANQVYLRERQSREEIQRIWAAIDLLSNQGRM